MQVIPLRQRCGNINLHPAQIVRIEGSSNYSRIFFTKGPSLLVCQLLKWFENLLPPGLFIRVHRSHLVNRDFISERPAETYLLLQNGDTIPVSRRKRKMVG